MKVKRTITTIKADVGSIGGHTRPSAEMLSACQRLLGEQKEEGLLTDFRITFTGDDICLLMVHTEGEGNEKIHNLAWEAFLAATKVAGDQGLYGAGQDLLVEAPSGNCRGAGPGVAEISFDMSAKERPVEAFLVFTADKSGPGAFNFPLWAVFTNPFFNSGLMLPKMKAGFSFQIIDMENTEGDKVITLETPERHLDVATLLRDENFGVLSIHSRLHPEQQIVSTSTDRLHSIAGEYKGKDDSVVIVRTQGIFPAPEEVLMPWITGHYVAGGARGSTHMPIMPVAINTAVTGPYCLPMVAAMAYSLNKDGTLSEGVDMFGNVAWDLTRTKVQEKAAAMREQGFVGPAMLPTQELEYGAIRTALKELEAEFTIQS